MDFNKKVYHSQVFYDCAKYFQDTTIRTDSIIDLLLFGRDYLLPIEEVLKNYKDELNSKELLNIMRRSLEENDKYFYLPAYTKVEEKIASYIGDNTFTREIHSLKRIHLLKNRYSITHGF